MLPSIAFLFISATIIQNVLTVDISEPKAIKSIVYDNRAINEFSTIEPDSCGPSWKKPVDCAEVLELGYKKSGIYKIWPKNRLLDEEPLHVFCDMDTDGGGWTVLQRRGNFSRPQDYFYKTWNQYKEGFGDLDIDFWIGNRHMYALTNQGRYCVRFDLENQAGKRVHALYDKFYIDDEERNYKLWISDYWGNAGDSMSAVHNSMQFSTKDRDNDNSRNSCAKTHKGAWWFNDCLSSDLNGLYWTGVQIGEGTGINWKTFSGLSESLAKTEIKIRPSQSINLEKGIKS